MAEHDALERKSLRLVTRKSPDWHEVARVCVCSANGRGGVLEIGIEDGEEEPPAGQTIPPGLPDRVFQRIAETTLNVTPAFPEVRTAPNGGEVLVVQVPTSSTLACTTEGRYYARLADSCKPVPPEDMVRLVVEKGALVWELVQTDVRASEAEPDHVRRLLDGLRASDRVKGAVKARTDGEILTTYDLVRDGRLTHLGVLWLGQREHRVRLRHAPIIQYLRYDAQGRKVDKEMFGDDYAMTPWEQVEAVRTLPVWNESIEVPQGVFRDRVPIYDVEVVRELVANALVHRVYPTSGDIFVSLYADRLEVHSPGRLPVGVTPENILHARKRRNESLARLFHDLRLMEGEGTGYNRMYDLLLSSGRPEPEVREGPDRVEVIVRGQDLDRRALRVIATASQVAPLEERERIVLGLLARGGPMTRAKLASALSLVSARDVPAWVGTLVERGLVVVVGRAAGQRLKANPKLLRQSDVPVKTTLIDIENHRLRELLRTDIEQFPGSPISEIIDRVGREIPRRRVQRQLALLRDQGIVEMRGRNKAARYFPTA
jgi:ATP-dependent DNA helicase RecG